MTQILICLLVLLFSLSGPAMGQNAHFRQSSLAAEATPSALNPAEINYSQRTVSTNVEQYTTDMANGDDWDWSVSGPLRVMQQGGQWVSYENRRLMAAQNAKLNSVPVQVVQPDNPGPSGMTWEDAFNARFNHPWNVQAGGPVPTGGLSTQQTIFRRGGN